LEAREASTFVVDSRIGQPYMNGARAGRLVLFGVFGLVFFLVLGLLMTAGPAGSGNHRTSRTLPAAYYVDSNAPCPGSGTTASPWCNVSSVTSKYFIAGDKILLKRGSTFTTGMVLKGSGTSSKYVTVGAYGTGPMPVIDGKDAAQSVGIQLYNESYVEVKGLTIENAVAGILINDVTNQTGYRFMHLVLSGNVMGIQSGSGGATASNVLVQDVEAAHNLLACRYNRCQGAALTLGSVANVIVNRLYSVDNCGATNLSLGAGASNVLIENSESIGDGNCAAVGGVTANFIDKDTNITFVNDIIADTPFAPGSVDFSAIDLEPNDGPDVGVTIENNYIAHNTGPGIELLDHVAAIANFKISGNVLVGNGGRWDPTVYPVWGQIWTDEWVNGFAQSTGSITDNLYYAPVGTGGFERMHYGANYNAVAQSDNIDVGGPDNVWYAANGFSCTTQGANGWSYQSSPDNSTWTDLSGCTAVDALDQEWTTRGSASGFVSNFEEMPPSNANAWVARSWTAPTSGPVSIRGRVLMSNAGCRSGITAEITESGSSTPIWGPKVIHAGDDAGVVTNLNGVSVGAGTLLHFAVREHGSSQCRVSWTPSVAR
jgi:hypothetical protein